MKILQGLDCMKVNIVFWVAKRGLLETIENRKE